MADSFNVRRAAVFERDAVFAVNVVGEHGGAVWRCVCESAEPLAAKLRVDKICDQAGGCVVALSHPFVTFLVELVRCAMYTG